MKGSLRRRSAGAVLVVALAVSACGGDDAPAEVGVDPIDRGILPSAVLGLEVDPEDLTDQLESVQRPYAAAAGLFSLRDGDELQATLQVTEFDPEVDLGGRDVEGTILAQIAKTPPLRLRVGDTVVYMSRADRQSVAVWFTDRHFLVLSTRDSYETPRELLRTLTSLETLA